MDSYHNQLTAEIHAELDRLAEEEQPWIADWITETICKKHMKGLNRNRENEDRRFWEYSARSYVRKQVTMVINKRAGDKTDRNQPRQIPLPGFNREHLQDYYTVVREGREQGIPVTKLSDEELAAKASFLDSMGRNCIAHAQEIRAYVRWRNDHEARGKAA